MLCATFRPCLLKKKKEDDLTGIVVRPAASLVAQMVKNLPAIQETRVQSLNRDEPLEEGMATHSSIFAWRIPTDRGAWLLQFMALQRIGQTEQLNNNSNRNCKAMSL